MRTMSQAQAILAAEPTLSPIARLHTLDKLWSFYGGDDMNRSMAERVRIQACAEGGQVAVVESGRDCDGVRYSGHVTLIPANWLAYVKHYNDTAKWADGPFGFAIMRPSEAMGISYESRDLTLEAFEDGHAHCIYA